MSADVQHIGHIDIPSRSLRPVLKPKDRRERLFRKSKPFVRRLEILDGEQYSKDIAILWAAYKAGSFAMPQDLTQSEFIEQVESNVQQYTGTWMVDDDSNVFSSKRGPVGMVSAAAQAYIIEPRFVFFKWATIKNKLRCVVSFLSMIRHSRKTGIILMRVTRDNMVIPQHLKDYDLAHYLGRSNDDEYLFSLRGRGSYGT